MHTAKGFNGLPKTIYKKVKGNVNSSPKRNSSASFANLAYILYYSTSNCT